MAVETNQIELITRMVMEAMEKKENAGNGYMVPVGVSARHIHLTQEHVEALFGPGYHLTKKMCIRDRYDGLNREYLMKDILPPTNEHMAQLKRTVERVSSLECHIGG